MARLLSNSQVKSLMQVGSIARKSGFVCFTSSHHSRIVRLEEIHKCSNLCRSVGDRLHLSQFTNMQKSVTDVPSKAVNNWLEETEEVYCQLKAKADTEGWIQIRNTNTDPRPPRFVFVRAVTENGPIIHYAMFVHKEKKKICGVCQFGMEAQGPPGLVHGGAVAAMHDSLTGVLTIETQSKASVTASLTINYKNPTPLRTPILFEGSIDKVESSKIFLTSCLKTPDGSKVYSNCSVLYIDLAKKFNSSQ